jgi:serine/threonine protein kinase
VIGECLRGRYAIVARIGQGGMGAVYLAEDQRLKGRRVAVKVIHFQNAANTATETLTDALTNEARMLAKLDYPTLPRVSDFFTADDLEGKPLVLVMDYIAGQDLAEVVKEARRKGRLIPPSQVLGWAETLCETLTYLHLQEPPVLHRDIKPANIKLAPDGTLRLVDFGIAMQGDSNDEATMTQARGLGSLPYMPLEQYGTDLSGNDPRADIYALGATLYHLLTGQQPLSAQERFLQPQRFQPPSAFVVGLEPQVERALSRAMALKPDERPASADAFKAELIRGDLSTAPVVRTPPQTWRSAVYANRWGVTGALVLMAVAFAITLWR